MLRQEIKEELYEFLNDKEFVTEKNILDFLNIKHNELKINADNYKWNFTSEKEPCNPTRYNFILRTKKIKGFDYKSFLTPENEYRLWHFFYSVKKKDEFNKGLKNLVGKLLDRSNLSPDYQDELIKNFSSFGGYANDYGTYSEKAIKKLLSFLRLGKYWNAEDVDAILKKATHEIKNKVLENEEINGELSDFQGLWVSSACYLVYGRHSEVGEVQFWQSPYDMENYLKNGFRQHSLNNPTVEKILVETLHVVKDIWKYFGEEIGKDEEGKTIYNKLFDRIHIELGREMKKNNKQKEKDDKLNKENRKANERIIELLKELKRNNSSLQEKSPFQQEKLRIVENSLLSSIEFDKDSTEYKLVNGKITKKEIKDITTKEFSKISKSDFERYKLWLDQRYQSPYTGRFIKLSDLFDRRKYEIEHIFPQERITLNALYNKVICETEINKEKKAFTGYGFIANAKSKAIFCSAHEEIIPVLSIETYEELVKNNFIGRKREILLSKEIPEEFTNSQLNNSQYITKMAMKLLSNIVREKDEDTFRSKNVLATNGTISTTLKRNWQLNDVWNEIIAPRFKRLNELTNSNLFGDYREINGHKVFINEVPEGVNKNLDPKRIDHRHHALDALAIALTTENHVNYLNNISSQKDSEENLKTRKAIKFQLTDSRKGFNNEKEWYFLPPAQIRSKEGIEEYEYQFKNKKSKVFKEIAQIALENTIASFKQKNRVIRQRWNKYLKTENEKQSVVTQDGLKNRISFNVRTPLHLDTFYGKVKLQNETVSKSLEKALNENFDFVDNQLAKKIEELKHVQKKSIKEIIEAISQEHKTVQVYEKYVASRFGNNLEGFSQIASDKIIKTIESITDTGIQRILTKHLYKYDTIIKKIEDVIQYVEFVADDEHKRILQELLNENSIIEFITIEKKEIRETEIFIGELDEEIKDEKLIKHNPQLAFSPDGIKALNENIIELNNGKQHQPIYKVRIADVRGTKFSVAEEGDKSTKFVVTAGKSNAFCGFYQNGNDRKFYIPTLRESVESLKQGHEPCPASHPENIDFKLIFVLNPSDLVYVPTDEEKENPTLVDFNNLKPEQIKRIYKFTDGSGTTMNFVPSNVSSLLFNLSNKEQEKVGLKFPIQNELGLGSPQSKNQNSLDGKQIKAVCRKIKIDRLGNIQLDFKTPYSPPTSQKENYLSKPVVGYGVTGGLAVFTSHDDMEDQQLNYMASLDPKEIMRQLKAMVLASFGIRREPELMDLSKTIHITSK
jgi:CRISPR-associated endonuclease Csn1